MLSNIKFRMTRVIVDRSVMTGTNGMRIPNTRLHHGNFLRDLVISEREREREYIFNRRSTIVQDLQQGLLGAFGAFLLIAVHILQDACSMHSRCQTQHALYMSCYTVEVSMHRQAIASIHQSWYIYCRVETPREATEYCELPPYPSNWLFLQKCRICWTKIEHTSQSSLAKSKRTL